MFFIFRYRGGHRFILLQLNSATSPAGRRTLANFIFCSASTCLVTGKVSTLCWKDLLHLLLGFASISRCLQPLRISAIFRRSWCVEDVSFLQLARIRLVQSGQVTDSNTAVMRSRTTICCTELANLLAWSAARPDPVAATVGKRSTTLNQFTTASGRTLRAPSQRAPDAADRGTLM
jgi:hypothetical protein